jgi:hypothetical protein
MALMGVVLAPSGWRIGGAILMVVGVAIGAGAMTGARPKPAVSVPWPPPVTPRKTEPVTVPPDRLETLAILPEEIHGVATSAYGPSRIAAWNDRNIYASHDEGKTFERVLIGDGTVGDVAFDAEGRLVAVRGDGWVGVRDIDDENPEELWQRADHIRPRDADDDSLDDPRPRLIVDRTRIAVIGVDPIEPTRLRIAWSAWPKAFEDAPLFHGRGERWDTVQVRRIEPAMPGQIQVVVETWHDGDCGGWENHQRVVFDQRSRTARARVIDYYGTPVPEPDEGVIERAVLDTDGRWLGLHPDDARRLVRTRL